MKIVKFYCIVVLLKAQQNVMTNFVVYKSYEFF